MISHLCYLAFSLEQKMGFVLIFFPYLLPDITFEKLSQKDLTCIFDVLVVKSYPDMSFRELNIKLLSGPHPFIIPL